MTREPSEAAMEAALDVLHPRWRQRPWALRKKQDKIRAALRAAYAIDGEGG